MAQKLPLGRQCVNGVIERGDITALEHLSLDYNQFTTLPSQICTLTALERLMRLSL